MHSEIQLPSPIQELQSPLFKEKKVRFFVKREDTIHPHISGNKWRKLQYNIKQAKTLQHTTLLTFGGAFSNHIAATAVAGQLFGFQTIGIIRGEKILPLNPTLALAQESGMQFHFVSRSDYRNKDRLELAKELCTSPFYYLPEGGTNDLAIKGCRHIIDECRVQFNNNLPNYFCVCCGTGGTISGIIEALEGQQQVIGFSALKGDFLQKEVHHLLTQQYDNWSINTDYHFGGYAKHKMELIDFINDFKKQFQISLDPIYTGKMFFGLFDLIRKDYFPKNSQILAVHTGGLQGIKGFNQRFGGIIE